MIVFVMSSEYYVDHERGLEQKLFQSCMGVKYGNQCERPLFVLFLHVASHYAVTVVEHSLNQQA